MIRPIFALLVLATAAGAGAAPPDGDGDGVIDLHDQCPGSEAGAPVTMRGCAHDADLDGVPDYTDDCPDSRPQRQMDEWGCPVAIEIPLDGVRFEVNSATLRADSRPAIAAAARLLQQYTGLQAEVAGHTDDRGSASHNRHLSRRRAEAVREQLVDAGIAATSLTARGYGEDRPVASNATEAGRAANRRVVLRILDGEKTATGSVSDGISSGQQQRD